MHTSASLGVTLYPDDAKDVKGLLKNADQAMYGAKDLGKNSITTTILPSCSSLHKPNSCTIRGCDKEARISTSRDNCFGILLMSFLSIN